MARARLVKPAFYSDVKLSEVSRDARLLYTGLWGLMDRRGLMEYEPKIVKRDIFPHDEDITWRDVDRWIWDLARVGRLVVRQWGGKRYLHCPHLEEHQHFHKNEKPDDVISDDVLTATVVPAPVPAPSQHGAGTVERTGAAPSEHPARPADSDTEAEAVSEAEADSDARARDLVHVCDRMGLTPPWREYWLPRVPDGAWLIDRLLLLETEKDAPGNKFQGIPIPKRANDFVRKGLKKRAQEVARSGGERTWQDVYADMTGETAEVSGG